MTPDWFVLHGATLTMAWFFALNAAVSAIVAIWARRAAPQRALSSSRWFALRLLPVTAAALFVGAIFVPGYVKYEPRETTEGFNVVLASIASGALLLLAAGVARGAMALVRARQRTRAWMRGARPMILTSTAVPAWEIDVDAPFLALAGIVRPRLLISRGLIETLTAEELAASLDHELGHARAWDNMKRLAMRAAPDLLTLTSAAHDVERQWASAAEHAADHAAGRHGAAARCALASALVKVARLMPEPTPAAEPISTLVGGGDIASRVQRLLADGIPADRRPTPLVAPLAAILLLATAYAPLLRAVHAATEFFVHTLP